MRYWKMSSALAFTALLAAGCDPEAPVQSSNVTDEINGAVEAHAQDSTTHTNLLIPAANISGELDGDQIEDGAIGIADIDTGAVGSDEIADQSIALADMGANSIGTLQIADDAINSAKIAANAVTATEIAAGAISGGVMGAIADNSISTADILNDSVTGADINDNTLTGADIADNVLTDADIMNDALTDASLADNSVTANELANNAVDANAIAANAVITAKILDANVTSGKLADGAAVESAANSKIQMSTSGRSADNVNFVDFYTFKTVAASPANVTIFFACGAEGGTAGTIRAEEDNTAIGGATAACPANSAAAPAIFEFTISLSNNKTYTLAAQAGAANSAVMWRHVSLGP